MARMMRIGLVRIGAAVRQEVPRIRHLVTTVAFSASHEAEKTWSDHTPHKLAMRS
jgi:hypothetical protein